MTTTAEYSIENIGNERVFVPRGTWRKEFVAVMIENDLRSLALSSYAGFHEKDISFLADMPFLDRLDLMLPGLTCVDSLYALKGLKELSVEKSKVAIDFGQFPELLNVALGSWSEKLFGSIFNCRMLRRIVVNRLPEEFLPQFRYLLQLENISIGFSSLARISGLPRLNSLTRLSLIMCNSLVTLDGIEELPNLMVIWIEKAKKLTDISSLRTLNRLRTLILKDCPQISSIAPLSGLQNLETVGLMQTTRIDDGDLLPLKTLPKLGCVRFLDRRHYTHRLKDFPQDRDPFY